ncbi:MAG: PadR family transcriptional regulator [Thermoplasmata archaeon]
MRAPRSLPAAGWRHGFLGVYALSSVEESPLYAHQLSTRIAERTQGAWRPSPGAIYPAFRSLVARGLVEPRTVEGRRQYFITPAGRREIALLRSRRRQWIERLGGSWRLMLDLVDPAERVEATLSRLRATLHTIEILTGEDRDLLSAQDRSYVSRQAIGELRRTIERLEHSSRGPASSPASRRTRPLRKEA